jgi:hypothetical protein
MQKVDIPTEKAEVSRTGKEVEGQREKGILDINQ